MAPPPKKKISQFFSPLVDKALGNTRREKELTDAGEAVLASQRLEVPSKLKQALPPVQGSSSGAVHPATAPVPKRSDADRVAPLLPPLPKLRSHKDTGKPLKFDYPEAFAEANDWVDKTDQEVRLEYDTTAKNVLMDALPSLFSSPPLVNKHEPAIDRVGAGGPYLKLFMELHDPCTSTAAMRMYLILRSGQRPTRDQVWELEQVPNFGCVFGVYMLLGISSFSDGPNNNPLWTWLHYHGKSWHSLGEHAVQAKAGMCLRCGRYFQPSRQSGYVMNCIEQFCGLRSRDVPGRPAYASDKYPAALKDDCFEAFVGSAIDPHRTNFTKGIDLYEYIMVAEALAALFTWAITGPEFISWFNKQHKDPSAFRRFVDSRNVKGANVGCAGERVAKTVADESWLANADSAKWQQMYDFNMGLLIPKRAMGRADAIDSCLAGTLECRWYVFRNSKRPGTDSRITFRRLRDVNEDPQANDFFHVSSDWIKTHYGSSPPKNGDTGLVQVTYKHLRPIDVPAAPNVPTGQVPSPCYLYYFQFTFDRPGQPNIVLKFDSFLHRQLWAKKKITRFGTSYEIKQLAKDVPFGPGQARHFDAAFEEVRKRIEKDGRLIKDEYSAGVKEWEADEAEASQAMEEEKTRVAASQSPGST